MPQSSAKSHDDEARRTLRAQAEALSASEPASTASGLALSSSKSNLNAELNIEFDPPSHLQEEPAKQAEQQQLQQQHRLLHELRVHQIELEMQNEALRNSQSELEASRDRYAELYDFAPIGYLTLSADGFIVQLNLCIVKLLATERNALIGIRFNTLVSGPDLLQWQALSSQLSNPAVAPDHRHNATRILELQLHRSDGAIVPVCLHCAATPQGQLRIAITDISERRLAEQALQESEHRFHQVLRTISTVAVQGYRMDGRTTYWNLASELLYGYSAEEAIGRNLLDLIIPPEMRDLVAAAMQQMAASGQPFPTGELLLQRKDGSRVTVISSHVLLQPPGHEAELFCLDVDISERRAVALALQASLLDKEALLKEVHHRVKNNLQVISSLLRLEAGRSAVADTKAVLQSMQGRIRAMAQLHESLYRSGTFASVDLGAYLGQLASQAFKAQVLDSARVSLRLEMASVAVSMDQAAACGLLVNELVSNSLKHGLSGSAHRASQIVVSLQAQDVDAQDWCLRVSDNGPGLAPDFELRRLQSLGLHLVDDLSRQIGGSLSIASTPGEGAAFSVRFKPAAPAALVLPP
ncbi:MAG: PAS domain S-box protein [Paucibacter sp.]|nr:PAS domain S-box protein [Roseateles sp.]